MTLREIIEALKSPDHIDSIDCMDLEVKFNTDVRFDMELLSVYYDNIHDVFMVDVD